MNWGSPGEFFAMGGYGLYVWGSYAVSLALMIAELALLVARKRGALERLRARASSRGGR